MQHCKYGISIDIIKFFIQVNKYNIYLTLSVFEPSREHSQDMNMMGTQSAYLESNLAFSEDNVNIKSGLFSI